MSNEKQRKQTGNLEINAKYSPGDQAQRGSGTGKGENRHCGAGGEVPAGDFTSLPSLCSSTIPLCKVHVHLYIMID